ncbi:MAG TPA: hypothetical protein VF335_00870 [Chitinivibrionales bacterium]
MENIRYLCASIMVGVLLLCGSIPAQDNAVKVAPKAAKAPSGEAAKASLAPKAAADTLVVVARLVEIPGKFPPNDLYNYVYIMKYHVVKVLKGSYAGQEIFVGHYNPLIPRKQIKDKMLSVVKGDVVKFQVNAKHTLVLVKPIEKIWKDAVEDDYSDSELDKYFALKADSAP